MMASLFFTAILFLVTYWATRKIAACPNTYDFMKPLTVFLWVVSVMVVFVWIIYGLGYIGIHLNVKPITI